jgi:transposase-like protein
MVRESEKATRLDECRRCGRAGKFRVAGALQSWTCTNCGTNNVVETTTSDGSTRIPVTDAADTPPDDPSIH